MDQVDEFFESIPWDDLQKESAKAPMSEECKSFFESLTKKISPINPQKQQQQQSPIKIDSSKEQTPKKIETVPPPAPFNAEIKKQQSSPGKAIFPRESSLTAADQTFYLAARYGVQVASRSHPLFLRLHPLVVAEQKEFNEWVAQVTAGQTPPPAQKDLLQYGTDILTAKHEKSLSKITNHEFSLHKELPMKKPASSQVHLRPIHHLFSDGRVASCQQFNVGTNCILQPEKVDIGKVGKRLSEDDKADQLASEHSADVVLSPGVLLALVNSAGKESDVPLTVKFITDANGKSQRVVVFDKPLPAINLSDQRKVSWAARKAAKRALFSYKEKYLNFANMKVERCVHDFTQDLEDYTAAKDGHENRNHVYSLWCLEYVRASRTADSAWGRQGCPIRLLVRSQCHGFQERGPAAPLFVHLGVKLERRPEWGAEALNLNEITRDWVAMTLRPEAMLLRARVDAKTLEVIQVEAKDIKTISGEARLKSLDTPAIVSALHSLLSEVLHLPEGSYLMRVDPKGAVVHLYGPPVPNHASIDLLEEYKKGAGTKVEDKVVGIQIDPDVATPHCFKTNRVPATFNPSSAPLRSNNKKSKKKKKKKQKSPK